MGVLGYEPLENQIGGECGSGDSPSRRREDTAVVASIEPASPAERAGLRSGDRILSINGEPIRDGIDLMFHASETELDVRWSREENGARKTMRALAERSPVEEFGLVLEDFRIRMCNNQCVFCFIHQNPPGLRKGIYFKDGDYRMSFLHGNYITTTNMKDEDFERIIEQRLAPVYVSVHTTNHELRLRMLGVKRSNDVLESLRRFAKGRIQFHTQIVLCPGWNDGAELDRTIRDLVKLRPYCLSVAIVPLGLTDHREGLPTMEPVTPSFCKRVIAQVEPVQAKLIAKEGEPVVYISDEFYITAGLPPPNYDGVEIMHQLENGVGMVWDFMRPWRSVVRKLPKAVERPRSAAILTGLLGARMLRKIGDRLNQIERLRVEIVPVTNTLFGKAVTVSGLLSGRDFLRAMSENPGHDVYLIPGNAVRAEGERFLDDLTMDQLRGTSRGRARAVEGNCRDLVEAVLG